MKTVKLIRPTAAGWTGCDCSDETQNELRRVAALLQQAIPLLERASEREERRLSADG